MTSRQLPPGEWSRLEGTELGAFWRYYDPEAVEIFVVEDDEGRIVGTWSLMPFVHAEGLWIDPEHRKHGAVLRRLWAAMLEATDRRGLCAVVTSAADDVVTDILVSRGASPMAASYVLKMDPKPRASDRQLGRQFHEQLFAQLPPAAQHTDDDAHHAAVGRAMRVGVFEKEPARAERHYNAWASQHGYMPVKFLETRDDGAVVVDIVEAVIAVSPEGLVTVLENRLESSPCQP